MKIKKIDAQLAQYFMRQAFEEGFRAAYDGSVSKETWFPHWVNSKTRATLVANGLIDKEVGYK